MIFDPRLRTAGLGLSVLAVSLTAFSFKAVPAESVRKRAAETLAAKAYRQLPLSFEPHDGSGRTAAAFVSRGPGCGMLIDSAGASVHVRAPRGNANAPALEATVSLKFVGAAPVAKVSGGDPLPGKSNYLLGNDPSKWRTDVPTFREVRCAGVYSGVDVVYYGNQQELEYDLVVAPGADPDRIRWQFQGAEKVELDTAGDLVLHTPVGEVRQRRPVVYQEREGRREEVAGRYVIMASASGEIAGLELGHYDPTRTLVIDPVLAYSTYLGGSGAENGLALAVDGYGNAYVTGSTSSTDFETTAGAVQTSQGGAAARGDVFVTKLDPSGSTMVYSTYLGGGGSDEGRGIAVDPNGSVYLTGRTDSNNFPTANALYATPRGDTDAFVTRLSAEGNALGYSTYLGGQGPEVGVGIAVSASGEASIAGRTASTNFPVANAIQPQLANTPLFGDAFVTRFTAGGEALVFSTYLGGDRDEMIGDVGGVAVDTNENTYVGGGTSSATFPVTAGAFDGTLEGAPGSTEGFIARLAPTGALDFATFLGGSANELISAIAVTSDGQACVTGVTSSNDFPIENAVRDTYSGSDDAFTAKLDSTGASLVYSTYLGGSGLDRGLAIAVDPAGGACVVGATFSSNFPISRPLQPPAGSHDAFVTRLNPLGTNMVFSTYLGGFSQDFATGVAIDPAGEVYVTGYTLSSGFPLAFPLQSTLRGTVDAFIARISEGAAPPVFPTGLTAESVCNTSVLLRWTDNSDDEDAFEIERKSGAGPFVPIAAVASDVAVYEDSGLSPNASYVYRVRATNQDGASTYSNELSVTTLLATVNSPSDLAVSVVSHNSLRLTWQDNSSDESGFRIERSTNGVGPFSLVSTVAANLEEFSDTGLSAETEYFYRVRAASAGCDSSPSPIASAETPSEPVTGPSGLVGVAVSESQISLTWVDQSANETGFRIERKTGDEFLERGQVGPNVLTFTDTGLSPSTPYSYRVRAVNGEGLSLPSNEVRVTTTPLPRGILKVPKKVNFGTVKVGTTKTLKLMIRNGSRAEQLRLNIGSVVPPFTATSAGIHTVLIGGNRQLTVTFTPTGPGKASTKLEVLSSDPRKPRAEIVFTGKGK